MSVSKEYARQKHHEAEEQIRLTSKQHEYARQMHRQADEQFRVTGKKHEEKGTQLKTVDTQILEVERYLEEKKAERASLSHELNGYSDIMNRMTEEKGHWSFFMGQMGHEKDRVTTASNNPISSELGSIHLSGNSTTQDRERSKKKEPLPSSESAQAPQKRGSRRKPSPNSIHPDYPTVILINGEWHELICKFCGTNANRDGELINGRSAFLMHLRRAHAENQPDGEQSLRSCSVRVFGSIDVQMMLNGEDPGSGPIQIRLRKTQGKQPASTSDDSTAHQIETAGTTTSQSSLNKGPFSEQQEQHDKPETNQYTGKAAEVKAGSGTSSIPESDRNGPWPIHARFSNIVTWNSLHHAATLVRREFFLISCNICGANSKGGVFFDGIGGLQEHVSRCHGASVLEENTDVWCAHVPVDDLERLASLRNGSGPDVRTLIDEQSGPSVVSLLRRNWGNEMSSHALKRSAQDMIDPAAQELNTAAGHQTSQQSSDSQGIDHVPTPSKWRRGRKYPGNIRIGGGDEGGNGGIKVKREGNGSSSVKGPTAQHGDKSPLSVDSDDTPLIHRYGRYDPYDPEDPDYLPDDSDDAPLNPRRRRRSS